MRGPTTLDPIRSRRGLKWGIPAMLLAASYLLDASICTTVIADGGPGWLNLLVLLLCWNALKSIAGGFAGVVLLIRVRIREAIILRRNALRHVDAARLSG